MKEYMDKEQLEEALEACVYRLEWSHHWNPKPYKSEWTITVYKDGKICEEELYCYLTFESSLEGNEKSESQYIGSFTGTKTWTTSSACEYQIYIYKDSNKSKLLCTDHLNPVVFDKTNIIDFLYPVGSVYTTSTNTNPNTILGAGTWTLTGKGFKDAQGNSSSSYFTKDTTNTDTYSVYYRRAGNTLTLRMAIKTLVAAADSTLTFGTLDLAALGVTTLSPASVSIVPRGAEAGLFIVTISNAGKITSVDVRPKSNSGTSIVAGTTFYVYENFNLRAADMLDSFCNKFYWQRTE